MGTGTRLLSLDGGARLAQDARPLYDRIGIGYATTRRPDPRIAARVNDALGDAGTVLNIGAGTGNYEPPTHHVVAVDPSGRMLAQRPSGSAGAVRGNAEALPFTDRAVDAAMAILTVHHWANLNTGLAEMRRVARRRIVILTFDPTITGEFWVTKAYFPAIAAYDRSRAVPISQLVSVLGRATVVPILIPHDCQDGFLGAYWRRPQAYFDAEVRAGISGFARLEPAAVEEGLARLTDDVATGAWAQQFGYLLGIDELDIGYRLIISEV